MGNPEECGAGFEAGKAIIQLVDNGDKVALIVAGGLGVGAAYSGFGRPPGCPPDAFDANWVMQRQGGGTTMVVRPGDAATYRAAGDTIVDQSKYN